MSIVRITTYGDFVGTGHNGPYYCDVAAIGKGNVAHPYVVANEFICSRLAMHLGLPVPAGGIVTDVASPVATDGLGYISMNVFPEGERPPPVPATKLVTRQWELTGITVFDAWIVSGDRHPQNIIWDKDLGVPLTFIDFELALTSHAVLGALTFDDLIDLPITRISNSHHDLVSTWTQLASWLDRIESVPEPTIEEIVYEAREMGAVDDIEAKRIIRLLLHRRDHLRGILSAEHTAGAAFRTLDRWGLV